MTTLTLTPTIKNTGLGCLNGLACPKCNAPMVDTLSGTPRMPNIKDAFCPMCEHTAIYVVNKKSIIR